MIEVYKYLHIYDQDTTPKHFRLHNRGSRRHEYPKDWVRGLQSNSFYYQTIKDWDELPGNVVNATTNTSFKKQVDDAWKDKLFKYNPNQLSGS